MKKYFWLLLLAISILPTISFFIPGLPVSHDGQDHVARIANFYKALSEGVLVPRWAGNLNWGYGHPVLMFLYPFSSYVASFLHVIGFSFVDATKGVFILGYVASMITMYIWMNAVWGKRVGFIGALLYGFAPYRFVDMYIRMAIGEHMAFIFPPLICYFLYALATRDKKSSSQESYIKNGIGLSLSMAFLILSHNAISMMFIPLIALYGLLLYFFTAKRNLHFIFYSIVFIILGFGLSAFFWIPAFVEGKYTLRNIVTLGMGLERYVPYLDFIYSPWLSKDGNTITKSLGIFHWIGIIAGFLFVFKTTSKFLRIFLITLMLLLFGTLFIMTSSSSFIWNHIMLLQNFQFPWRFLSLTTFISAVIGGISIPYVLYLVFTVRNKIFLYSKSRLFDVCMIVFCLLIIISTIHMWRPKAYQTKDESFYTGIYNSTTDTGESSPIWTTRFMELAPKDKIEVISGIANVKEIQRLSYYHTYSISAQTRAEFLENTIYFPGWVILVDGKITDIQFQSEIHRGIMSFWVDKGEHIVEVKFIDTKIRKVSNSITIISGIVMIFSLFISRIWKKRK